jgi:16S rRNA (guanine527-N7)-methyltransferase
VVDELGLADRVTVVRGRAEDHRRQYAAVLSRAVAPLVKLVPWCAPLCSPAGTVLALKGRSARAELDAAQIALAKARLTAEVLTLRAHPATEPATVVRLTPRP